MSVIGELVQSAICRVKLSNPARPFPTLFSFPGLTSKPLHTADSLQEITDVLKRNYSVIKDDYMTLKSISGSDYELTNNEHQLHSGKWDWRSYILRGKRQSLFAINCTKTVDILESFESPRLMTNTPFSFAFFSTLSAGAHIMPHYGPCNLRIRCHFPLHVPNGDCGMRIGNDTIRWVEGEPLYFDDCYQHEGK
jgi:aspartate beta-hydroxylase